MFCGLSLEHWIAIEMIKQEREVIRFPLQKDPSDCSVENGLLRIKQSAWRFVLF